MAEREFYALEPGLLKALGGGKRSWSEAVRVGDVVWISGQVGWDKTTAELANGFEAQVKKSFENLEQVLERCGSSIEDVIMTGIYLTDADDYRTMDGIAYKHFPREPPARPDVVVRDHIGHALFDMEAVAVVSGSSLPRKAIPVEPKELFNSLGHPASWSDAVSIGDLIYVTGQIGWDKRTGEFLSGIEAQTQRALELLQEVLERASSGLEDVVMMNVFLTNHNDFDGFDEAYQRFFPKEPPARTVVVVQSLVDHNTCLIDIVAVAVKRG